MDHGVDKSDAETVGEDGDEADAVTLQRIPVEADFIMCYSVVKGCHRNNNHMHTLSAPPISLYSYMYPP